MASPAVIVGNRRVTIQEVCDVACKGVQVQLEPNALAALADADKGETATATATATDTATTTATATATATPWELQRDGRHRAHRLDHNHHHQARQSARP